MKELAVVRSLVSHAIGAAIYTTMSTASNCDAECATIPDISMVYWIATSEANVKDDNCDDNYDGDDDDSQLLQASGPKHYW